MIETNRRTECFNWPKQTLKLLKGCICSTQFYKQRCLLLKYEGKNGYFGEWDRNDKKHCVDDWRVMEFARPSYWLWNYKTAWTMGHANCRCESENEFAVCTSATRTILVRKIRHCCYYASLLHWLTPIQSNINDASLTKGCLIAWHE